ncbi:MAG: aminomethyl-transferring glycine dehydrogenase subunit GcvPB [Planctomycetota bacterium]|nr:aminomethyl-transferring glycine dehydrogenase subunit GcvPB [Planctomycetota bacterium]
MTPESIPIPAAEATLFELSRPGRRGVEPPEPGNGIPELAECLGENELRRETPALPELAEASAVRHYTRLSSLNMSIDTNFYPLGSCTMKYNPRINEVVAGNPGFSQAHPLYDAREIQGYLELFSRLEEMLAEISGLPHISLQPAAGAHGELTALMMIKARCRERDELERDVVLIPDSAHGTNPSSCTIAGFKTRNIDSGEDGTIDIESLREALGPDVAAMMITNPNTLGIFESGIEEISSLLHEAGALLYMDGANMNAILGITRPGDFGVDVMHYNLHKTMSTPHGGGGPGAGPIAVTDELEPYLPVPRIVHSEGGFELCADRPLSIGKVRTFFGNSGILVRAYAYLRAHGPEELRGVSEHAVLNANYIRRRLEKAYHLPYETPCMHEVVFTARNQKATGIRALDIAKRLIDMGYHPPTIYFPLVVHEALMIEPTETETQETLDRFCDAMLQIAREAGENPELLKAAPVNQPVKRLDEVNAVKTPILTCPCDEPVGD